MSTSGAIATRSATGIRTGEAAPVKPADLTGPQKAAVMLLILGDEYGKPIWAELEEDEVRIISRAMAELGTVEAEQVERLMIDFVSRISNAGSVTGSFDRTESLLARVLPKSQVNLIMEEIRGPAGRNMWQKLANIDASVLANFLKNEYPQTIAVVLTRIRSDHAARVLSRMPDDLAIDVVSRMLRIDSVQKEALDHIEATLRSEFVSTLSMTTKRDPHETMAEIFNGFDRQTEARFLSALDISAKESALKIRSLMFTFDDLAKLDTAGVQTLLRGVDKDTLARSLKGATDQMREFFFKGMSSRAAKLLQDDMQTLGPMRLKEVDEAQQKMVNVAKDLADKGELVISKNNSEDELVY
jgi:flagellar motor switch protein FliG